MKIHFNGRQDNYCVTSEDGFNSCGIYELFEGSKKECENYISDHTVYADWNPQRKDFRIYRPDKPQDTIAYVDFLCDVDPENYHLAKVNS